jgi:hypothetical protein
LIIAPGEAAILQQNIDRQAGHGESGTRSRALHSDSLTAALDLAGWRRLVRKVARMVREMPSGACRRIGAEQLNFVYDNCGVVVIQFLAGIACCFRKTESLGIKRSNRRWIYRRLHHHPLLKFSPHRLKLTS